VVKKTVFNSGGRVIAAASPEEGFKVMKGMGKYASLFVTVLALVGLMFLTVPRADSYQNVIDAFGERRKNGPGTKVSFSDQAAD